MQNAAQEVRNINNPNGKENDIVDSDICIDGSWQKRGHNSLNGVVTDKLINNINAMQNNK